MKSIKKYMNFAAATLVGFAAFSLVFTSCAKEEGPVKAGQTVELTVGATFGNPDTRTVLTEDENGMKTVWAEGDRLLVTDENGAKIGVLDIEQEGVGQRNAQFTGFIANAVDGMTINLFYLGDGVDVSKISDPTFPINFEYQSGLAADLNAADVMFKETTIAVGAGVAVPTEEVAMAKLFAIAHFEVILPEGYGPFEDGRLTIVGKASKAELGLGDGQIGSFDSSVIRTVVEETDGDVYVNLLPVEIPLMTFGYQSADRSYQFTGRLDGTTINAGDFIRLSEGVGIPVEMRVVREPEPDNQDITAPGYGGQGW